MSRAQQASDRAADWIIRRENGYWSDADQAEFESWLEEADGNKAAYWRLKHSWREADLIGALGFADRIVDDERRLKPMARWWMAIAASLVLMIGAGSVVLRSGGEISAETAAADMFSTPVGGRRTIPLADGSKVELSTASVVRAALTETSREVWLDKGEAFFEVAHLSGRPFVVHAGSRTITVLGTKFSVRRDGDKVMVSVVEGRVRIAADAASVPAAVLSAGGVAIARGPSTLFAEKSEERVANALAWRSGMLSFDRTTLSDVAAEFNRYNLKPLVIADSETAAIRIGGSFPASDPDAFVRLLRDAYGLRVETRTDAVIISN